MTIEFRVKVAVVFGILSQNFIKIYPLELNFDWFFKAFLSLWRYIKTCSFVKVLDPWEILLLFDVFVEHFVQVVLTSCAEKSGESRLAHAWETDWHQNEFFDATHFFLAKVFEKILVQLVLKFVQFLAQWLQFSIVMAIFLTEHFRLRFFHFELLTMFGTGGEF